MKIEKIIEAHIKNKKSPGVSVGIFDKNQTNFFNYGEIKKDSNIKPTKDTVFEIGSVTKPFAAILAAKLEQEGVLSLSEPITTYLPQIKSDSDIARKKITTYHLITNTGDLPTALPLGKILPYLVKLYLKKDHPYNPYSDYTRKQLYDYLSKRKIKRTPGEIWSYSNYGYSVIGHICEAVTGLTFEDLVKEKICKPLGMKDTGINLFDSHKDKMATGYTLSGSEANFWSSPSMEGMISLRSTVGDLVKFLGANLGLIKTDLSPTLNYCLSTKVNPKLTMFMKYYPKYAYGLPISRFRLGWFVFDLDGQEMVGHDGGTEGFSSFVIMNLEKKTGVVILTNKLNPRPIHKLGMKLLKEISNH